MIVYKVTDLHTGRIYIGQTVLSLEERMKGHFSAYPRTALSRALRKFGKENFKWDVMARPRSISRMNFLEKKFIIQYSATDPQRGYNLHVRGSGTRDSYFEKTPIKIIKKLKITRQAWNTLCARAKSNRRSRHAEIAFILERAAS